jgi:hypothetical protein
MSEQEQQREAERYQEWCAERDAQEEQQYYIYLEDRIAELEAENRIFRSTESVDDSVWDALLEQVRTFQAKLDRVRGCQQYVLKGSGTPAEVMSGGTYMRTTDVLSALGDEE